MSEIFTVGLDLEKNVFQVHGADGSGRAVLRKKLRREQVLAFSQSRDILGSVAGLAEKRAGLDVRLQGNAQAQRSSVFQA